MTPRIGAIATGLLVLGTLSAYAQRPPGQQGSSNVKLATHVPVGGWLRAGDVEIEQELSRPYAYIAIHALAGIGLPTGIDIIDLKDLSLAHVLYSVRVDHAELHRGAGSLN